MTIQIDGLSDQAKILVDYAWGEMVHTSYCALSPEQKTTTNKITNTIIRKITDRTGQPIDTDMAREILHACILRVNAIKRRERLAHLAALKATANGRGEQVIINEMTQ